MAAATWEERREYHSKTLHNNVLGCHTLIIIKQVQKFADVTVFKEPSQRLQKHSLDLILG
jgi:hypothetical protein